MTTCTKCQARRAKRNCPGLGSEICPPCCGTLRLKEIRCPDDCRYLEGAFARAQKTEEVQRVALATFNRERAHAFPTLDERYLAFVFEGAAYTYWKEHRDRDAEALATSYECACRGLGAIALPGDARDPLAAALMSCVDSREFGEAMREHREGGSPVTRALASSILRRLAEFVRDFEKRAPPWRHYLDGLEEVFERVRPPILLARQPAPGEQPRPSGLILPR